MTQLSPRSETNWKKKLDRRTESVNPITIPVCMAYSLQQTGRHILMPDFRLTTAAMLQIFYICIWKKLE